EKGAVLPLLGPLHLCRAAPRFRLGRGSRCWRRSLLRRHVEVGAPPGPARQRLNLGGGRKQRLLVAEATASLNAEWSRSTDIRHPPSRKECQLGLVAARC